MAVLNQTEKFVVKRTLEWLALAKVPAWRNNTGTLPDKTGRPVKFGKTGSGDILGLIPGQGTHLECECKDEKRKQEPSQIQHMSAIRSAGGVYLLLRPSNFISELERNIATRLPLSTSDILEIRRRLGIEKVAHT